MKKIFLALMVCFMVSSAGYCAPHNHKTNVNIAGPAFVAMQPANMHSHKRAKERPNRRIRTATYYTMPIFALVPPQIIVKY